ncbi:MAG: hypothetical protein ACKN9K_29300 [Dolichospermum sp.]
MNGKKPKYVTKSKVAENLFPVKSSQLRVPCSLVITTIFNANLLKGEQLGNLHLMKYHTLNNLMTTYQQIGDNQVNEVT